jgi:quinol monooxygenase YgiN
MIIVSGHLQVHPDERAAYLDGCRAVIEAARAADGCLDFHLAADPVEPGRINVYEEWDSVVAVDAFRGSGPSGDQTAAILDARVRQHEVSSSIDL